METGSDQRDSPELICCGLLVASESLLLVASSVEHSDLVRDPPDRADFAFYTIFRETMTGV